MRILKIYKKITLKHIIYAFCILPLLSIPTLYTFGEVSILPYWLVFSALILSLLLIKKNKFAKDKSIIFFCLYSIILVFSTFYNSGLKYPGTIFTFICYILLFLLMRDDYKVILSVISFIGVVTIFITFISILFSDGESSSFFLGGKNRVSIILIPLSYLIAVNSITKHGKTTLFNLFIICLTTVCCILTKSSTGIVVGIISLLSYLLLRNKTNKLLLIIVFIANFVLIFFFNILSTTNFWIDFTSWLGKDATLTNRFSVWSQAVSIFSSSPIIGGGSGSSITFFDMHQLEFTVTEAHNFFLEVLYTSGLLGTIFFILFFAYSLKPIRGQNRIINMLLTVTFVILINGFTESTSTQFLFLFILNLTFVLSDKTENSNSKNFKRLPSH